MTQILTPVMGLQNPTTQEKFVIWLYFMRDRQGWDLQQWRASPFTLKLWYSLHEVKLET